MNKVSFRLPEKVSLLEAQPVRCTAATTWRYGAGAADQAAERVQLYRPGADPSRPDTPLEKIEATQKATTVRWFAHNATVEVVFQSTATMQSDSNPMHLHGHD
jgi:laccase